MEGIGAGFHKLDPFSTMGTLGLGNESNHGGVQRTEGRIVSDCILTV